MDHIILKKIGIRLRDAFRICTKVKDDIYVGISPHTGKALYAARTDERGLFRRKFNFNQAAKRARKLSRRIGKDCRIPFDSELNELYRNRVAIGGFHETGGLHNDRSTYWSDDNYGAERGSASHSSNQHFGSDGFQHFGNRQHNKYSVRLVWS